MVHLRKEIFPTRTYSKLRYKKIGPCKITRKCIDISYEVELTEYQNIFLFSTLQMYISSMRAKKQKNKKARVLIGYNNFQLRS